MADRYAVIGEGNRYYEYLHLKNADYWLRTRYTGGTGNAWLVYQNGNVTYNYGDYTTAYSLAPCIRLSHNGDN